MGAEARPRRCRQRRAADRRQFRPAGEGAGDRSGDRPRHRRAPRAHRQPRSTTRSTTPSASARCRRSMPRSTSTTSSWRWRRSTGRARRLAPDLCQHQRRRGQRHQSDERARRDRPRASTGGEQHRRSRRPPPRSPATRRAISANNALADTGHGGASTGAAVSTARETMVPLAAFSHYGAGNTPLAVNHQGLFVAATISFNLAPGVSLERGAAAIEDAMRQIGVPASIHGSFQGTAKVFQQSLDSEPYSDRRGAARRLHRARHALRELRPPDHDPVDAAVGRRRRGAGADGVPGRHSSSASSR